MFEFLKSEGFKIVGSAILGIGFMAVLKPVCKGSNCTVQKAPSVEEVTRSTYHLSGKCYQFKTTLIECPKSGIIEPFHS